MGDALKDVMSSQQPTTWETTREHDARIAQEKLERARLVGVVEALGRSRDGLNFLRWLLDKGAVFESPQYAGVEFLNFRNGARSIGLAVFELCREAGIAGEVCAPELEGR